MKTENIRKWFGRILLAGACMTALLLPVTAGAAQTYKKTLDVQAGEVVYIMNDNLAGSGILSNNCIVAVTKDTVYDLVFSSGTQENPTEKAYLNLRKSHKTGASSAYIQESLSAAKGCIMGIYVQKGAVRVTLQSTAQKTISDLKLWKPEPQSSHTPIRLVQVGKNKGLTFYMTKGNVKNIPLILCGYKGTKIKRILSSAKKNYEIYTFGSSSLSRTTYKGGKKAKTATIKYNSSFNKNGKTYRCALIQMPASTQTRSSGSLKTTKGIAIYGFPREFLGIEYKAS